MVFSVTHVNCKSIWEDFVTHHPQANFLQSWFWGEVHQKLGCKIFRLGFYHGQKIIGIALLIKKEARRGRYLECSGGPLFNEDSKKFLDSFTEILKILGVAEKCHFIRIRPQLPETQEYYKLFKQLGFVIAPMHLHAQNTWQLNITKSDDQLLKEMRKSTRYLIKKAIRDEVRVTNSTDPKDINWLYQLQLETAKRHHFIPFQEKFFLAELRAFAPVDKIRIFRAEYCGEVLSVAIIIFYGNQAVYHYSGSGPKALKIPATYLMLWEAISEAKKRGLKIFNFWGIAPNDNPQHRFAGVTLFKKGFGGYRVDYLPAQDLPLTHYYWIIYIFERLRKIFRRL